MEHSDVKELGAVEKYLLQELPPGLRDEFEDHFFDCQECTVDLRVTAAFMEAAKKEFTAHPVERTGPIMAKAEPARERKARFGVLQWPAILTAALAASLLVIGYQNVVVYPKMESQLAQLETPEILPAVSLVGGNSRGGGAIPSATVSGVQPLLISADIPTQPQYTSYTCLLYAPSGALDWRVEVSSHMANDTVTISAPAKSRVTGTYTLVVQGVVGQGPNPGVELARYPFNLAVQR